METQLNYVEIIPNKIIISKPLGATYYESRISINNLTDKYVIFKVYINKNTLYSANPSCTFIKPKDSVVVNIKRLERVYFLLYLGS